MVMSVLFCLSCDLLYAILSSSKLVYFNVNLHCCNWRGHDVTSSRWTCGHNIIYDMMLSTEYKKSAYDKRIHWTEVISSHHTIFAPVQKVKIAPTNFKFY